jgi:hypothetical protein
VDRDLYLADGWKTRLMAVAKNTDQDPQRLVPSTYLVEKAGLADSLDAYANDLARKVRMSYPTQVVGRMLATNQLQLNGGKDNQSVQAFLHNATPLGFALGRSVIDSFISTHKAQIFPGATPEQIAATTQQVKTLQRLYQITPTNDSLKIMLQVGFTSAYDVVAHPYDDFIRYYGQLFPSFEEAQITYRKAEQITTVTRTFFSAAQQISSNPPVLALSASQQQRQAARDTLIQRYPTLNTLFGSLDFCECEHCRSVLSPAAYFVDLLQFLELGQNDAHSLVWPQFLSAWKQTHNNAPYPFIDQASWIAAGSPAQTEKTPYTVLSERRPDLPYLPLTCENTNTVMPYIDIVNEILEYFIVHGSLDQNAVHDSADASSADLLAEPRHILPAAYETLKQACYPLTLPFDIWLATVRGFFDYYQLPFWQVLDLFRPSEELFPPQANAQSYYRASIFAEYLGITPSEYAIYSGTVPQGTLAQWFALYGYQSELAALTALPSAKMLAGRLGVSYTELIALVQTGFLNPQLQTLGILYTLGVTVADVLAYEGQTFTPAERAAFEQKLADLSTTFSTTISGFAAKTWLDKAWQQGDLQKVLVLHDPNPGGNFDQTILQYADGTAAENLVFLKINLFVRLWKRSGWSMEETDRALQVFLPRHTLPLTAASIGAAFTTALLSMAHLSTLAAQCRGGHTGRLQLLTLWSDLATTGSQPLYARLFLTKSILQNDLVFDHPLGLYLTFFDTASNQYQPFHWDSSQQEDPKTGNVSLKTHLNAVQGALSLSADEIGLILADAGKSLESEPLTMATLSLLYRYGLLAKGLGLAVKDLLALKSLSGLDPMQALSPDPVTQLAADMPLTRTLAFVTMVTTIKSSGFSVEDLLYLLRQRFDPVGKYRPDSSAVLALLRTLATGIRSLQAEHALPPTASGLTDDFLRQRLALVLPSDAVDTFFAMWSATITSTVTLNAVTPADQLNQTDYTQEPEIQVRYDTLRQTQQLTFRGVLLATQKAQIELAHPSPVLAALLDQMENLGQTYYSSYLQPFLPDGDFTALFTPLAAGLTAVDKQTQMQARRLQFTQTFLPYLRQKLTSQFVISTLATTLAADPTLIGDLLTDAGLLSDPTNPPAQGQPANPLLGAFTSSAEQGISVAFYATPDASGAAFNAPVLATTVDTASKPNGTNSAHFAGYLEVPTGGAYRFFVELNKQNASAVLHLTDWPDPLLSVTAVADKSESSQFIELQAGRPYHFTFDVSLPGGGDVALLVQGENLARGSLDRLALYTQAADTRVTRAWILLMKTLQIMQTSGFSKGELRYLLTHSADFANLSLSALPTQAADDTAGGATALFAQFLRLADYTSLKRALAANTDDLVDLFAHARLSYPLSINPATAQAALFSDVCQRVANLTRRDVATVQAVASALGFTTSATPLGIDQIQITAPAFTQEQGIQRLWTALQTISTLGVSMQELARWLTPAPDVHVARDLRNTLKSLYGPEDWQRIARPIFDTLRQRQRDALVVYIMQQQGFTLPEQLFEYFLIDPGMEPVVQTSRLVLAISSVQTFIQRCLLNLEQEVSPAAINAEQWLWMKRYRIWEANRKIFLYPENWLEPEFRDDKTYLFRELEGKLLQSDVSNDLAEDAFFDYLKDLEMLARLQIVSMYCQEQSDPSQNVVHVIGRTYNTPHKYFYRTLANQMWTPWVPVTLDIEGDHVVAVVWKQRLHLFWVTFMVKAKKDATSQGSSESYKKRGDDQMASPPQEVDIQLNWSAYFQGTWTPRRASDFGNVSDIDASTFQQSNVYIYVSKETRTDADGTVGDGAVNIMLTQPVGRTFRVVNKHSPPQVSYQSYSAAPYEPYSHQGVAATSYEVSGELDVTYMESADISNTSSNLSLKTGTILTASLGTDYSLLFASNLPRLPFTATNEPGVFSWFDSPYLVDLLLRPFFYQDSENTFFVEPTMTEQTIDEWDWWVIQYPWPYAYLNSDSWWSNLLLQAAVPTALHFPPSEQIDVSSLYRLKPTEDWLTNPTTVLHYGDHFVGKNGGLTALTLPPQQRVGSTSIPLKPVVPPSSTVSAGGNGQRMAAGSKGAVLQNGGLTLVNQGGLTKNTLARVQVESQLNGSSGTNGLV